MENNVVKTTQCKLTVSGSFILELLRRAGYDMPAEKDVTISRILKLKKKNEIPKDKYEFHFMWSLKEEVPPQEKGFVIK